MRRLLLVVSLLSACGAPAVSIPDGCTPAWQQIAGDDQVQLPSFTFKQGSVWVFGMFCAPGAAPVFPLQGGSP